MKQKMNMWASEWLKAHKHPSAALISYWIYGIYRSGLQAVKGPGCDHHILHRRLYHTFFLPVPEGWGQRTHRKEGNHAKLNNAVAQSPHYDLVNGWLYKHTDPPGLPRLTAQCAGWIGQLLQTLLLLSWLDSILSIPYFCSGAITLFGLLVLHVEGFAILRTFHPLY